MADETLPTSPTILDWLRDPTNVRGWEAFATNYRAPIKRWCLKYGLREPDAEDLTQDLMMDITDKIESYDRTKGKFRQWLKAVTHHACVDVFRQQKREPRFQEFVDANFDRVESELEPELDDHARTEVLRVAMQDVKLNVKPNDWQIFYETVFEQRPAAEIAEAHGKTLAAVHQIKYRVQRKIKEKSLELDEANTDGALPNE